MQASNSCFQSTSLCAWRTPSGVFTRVFSLTHMLEFAGSPPHHSMRQHTPHAKNHWWPCLAME